jgi:hypothetical protein
VPLRGCAARFLTQGPTKRHSNVILSKSGGRNTKCDERRDKACLDAIERQIPSLQKIPPLRHEVAPQHITILSLQDRVSSLIISLDAYKPLRNRFISVYKRDKLNNATDADKRIIGVGNAWARGDEAVVDAMLYSSTGPDGRCDAVTYKPLSLRNASFDCTDDP